MIIERSNEREQYGRWLGLRCSSPDKRFWTETHTYKCEICKKSEQVIYEMTELLHVPMILEKRINCNVLSFRNVEWGHKGRSFWACDSHLEVELDAHIESLKILEALDAKDKAK